MIKVARLTFITEDKFNKRAAEKLRGFFSTLYREEDLFHNHLDEKKVIYRLPLIQYKIIDEMLNVFGYNQAVPVLSDKFLKVKEITINGRTITHFETQITIKNEEFYISDELHSYYFESLWLPINQKNYLDYINNKLDLNKVLRNNILTNFKGLSITADKKIMAKGEFVEKKVLINDIEWFAFSGEFVANAVMPDYMSLGRNRAIGFGSVKRREK
jgi:hypothetical protein